MLEQPYIGANTRKMVQCHATITQMGVHKSQCSSLAVNTGDPSFCNAHKRALKFKPIATFAGPVWTQEGFDNHKERLRMSGNPPVEPSTTAKARIAERIEQIRNEPELKEETMSYDQTKPTTPENRYDGRYGHAGDESDEPPDTRTDAVKMRIREAEAIPAVMAELAELDVSAASRVLEYVSAALGIARPVAVGSPSLDRPKSTAVKGIVKFVVNSGRNLTADEIAIAMGYPLAAVCAALSGCTKMGKLTKVSRPDGTIGFEGP